MGKLIDAVMVTGSAITLAGSLGVAVTEGMAEDNYSRNIGRICILENALEHRALSERQWVQQAYAALEAELKELKDIPGIMQEKNAYESARESESVFLLMLGMGYTLCIAGVLKERTEKLNHKP